MDTGVSISLFLSLAKEHFRGARVKASTTKLYEVRRRTPLVVVGTQPATGVIERIDVSSEWVSPVMISRKKCGKIRLCVDLRGPNSQLVSEVFFKRVPFGLASAGAAFQKLLDRLLAGIPGCQNYLDDIVCTGRTQQEHDERLKLVMKILRDAQLLGGKLPYSYEVEYVPGSRLPGTDALSRLPVTENIEEGEEEYEIVALLDDEGRLVATTLTTEWRSRLSQEQSCATTYKQWPQEVAA
ncbi:hypothetical protein O3P69_005265 [Scylla paramamosain]|uniref:Reverse transcriptase domain-containing protein n=1 Tax=Scylla paramamosain TaxID=85552 RepID=A0AAW0U9L2_SCYPA